jgi:methionine-rich copper-binding protein CopC
MQTMRRGLLAGLAAAALFVVGASPALAHAAYKDSDPADEATVANPPTQVTAEFTEPITDSSYLEVYDPCGDRVDNGDTTVSQYEMSVTMSAEVAGEYTVEFAAQSIDSHVTYGSFSFTSSGGSECAGAQPPKPPDTGGGGGGGSSGGGSTRGAPAPGAGGGPAGSTGGGSGGAAVTRGSRAGADEGDGRGDGGARGGARRPVEAAPDGDGPVAFQNTGDRAPRRESPWDLPVGAAVMALVLCVLIGAAGGRVYAGIVAPPRR